jgi:uncharacterized membrane protein
VARSTNPKDFLTEEEARQVTEAVAEAERRTSAELKLVIARHCWASLEEKAAAIFRKQGLDRTAQRNGVLILLVTTNREFLIHGDQGIHEKVGQDFWEEVRDAMAERFRAGEIGDGLAEGIRRIGEALAGHFPWTEDDENELSDEVAYED